MSPRAEVALRTALLAVGGWIAATILGAAKAMGIGVAVPLGASLVLGALLGWAGRERWVLAFSTVTTALLFVAGFTPLVPAIGRQLTRRDPPARVDAVVVLGGGITAHGLAETATLERLLSALEQVPPGDSTPLVLSDVRPSPTSRVHSGDDLRRLVAAAGGRRVFMQGDVFATHDEALGAAVLARRHGWRRLAVITSPSHSARACRTFEGVGLTVSCWPSDERGARVAAASTTAERVAAASQVVYELLGWLVYKARGWA